MHIGSVISAPWVGWVMFALLLCPVLAEWSQPGVVTQSLSSFFAHTNRTYRESPATIMGQFLITLFRLGVVTMTLFLCFYAQEASWRIFVWILVSVIVVVLVKMLVNTILDFTFQLSRRFGGPYEPYGDLVTMIGIALYPALLFLMHFGSPRAAQWVAGIAALVFIGLWIFRSWRTYVSSLIAPIYLLLYIATMEVLPMAGLAYLSGKLITLV